MDYIIFFLLCQNFIAKLMLPLPKEAVEPAQLKKTKFRPWINMN